MRSRPAFWWTCIALVFWACFTAASTVNHRAIFLEQPGALYSAIRSDRLRPVMNALHMATLPGWAPVVIVAGRESTRESGMELAAAAIAGAGWIAGGAVSLGLLQIASHRSRKPSPHTQVEGEHLSRRAFLARGGFASIGMIGVAGGANATILEPFSLRLARYEVKIENLPRSLDGLRIAQISDTHRGPRVPLSHIRAAVARALELDADLYLLTGDYSDRYEPDVAASVRVFAPIVKHAPGRVTAVLGNHDWYCDGPATRAALRALSIPVLDNARLFLCARTRTLSETPFASCLCVAGVGDLHEDTADIDAALRNLPPDMPRILLSHNPDVAEDLRLRRSGSERGCRCDLMLSGHTHGGQVALPFIGPLVVPSAFGARYAGGLVQGPACPVIVSRGVGMSVLPVRFGVPPEIVEITLRRGGSA